MCGDVVAINFGNSLSRWMINFARQVPNPGYDASSPDGDARQEISLWTCGADSISNIFSMWILPFVGYLGMILGFGFLTLAIGTWQPANRNS